MGAIAIAGIALYFWRVASFKTALLFLSVVAVGVASYWFKDEQRPCDGRAWFCDFMPVRGIGFVGPPDPREHCPDDVESLTVRVFQSDAAEAEVHRLIDRGVCQEEAIKQVANGWKAAYDPNFGSWWERLIR